VFLAYESLKYKYYTPLGPGPGFFPLWLSLALATLSVVLFFQATFGRCEEMPPDFFDSRVGYLRALAMCGAWVLATALLEPFGYRLTMMIFFPSLLLSLGRVKWYTILAFTILGSVIAFWVFTRILLVALPVGAFDTFFEPIDTLLESVLSGCSR